jgi:hypothetical protein
MFGNVYLVFVLLSVGNTILIRSEGKKPPCVGCVQKITKGNHKNDNAKVTLRWYYRREEIEINNKFFLGKNELVYSEHKDVISVKTIMGKCVVYNFHDYCMLKGVGPLDFYHRFDYDHINKVINVGGNPDTKIVAV